ncbi:hypothetical protein HAZT_HAZT009879 [Hyalella azteca]|uniref:RING-type E3 ubiquitin transferase n=1 Tax=Hyalella azteca TaxID=294128 RepID=A0A6A0HC92_HYAAZ|nr:hypothetical protein HAZT_HAZT009879 [Hyalella azteca]
MSALEELAGNPGDYVWGRGGLDAVITHFMGQLENNGPAPLTADQIAAIPSTQVTQEQCQNKMQCSVCMEDFVLSESVKKLRCDHFFHEPCITPWLKMHATCPVCRTALGDAPPDGSAAAGNQLRLGLGGRRSEPGYLHLGLPALSGLCPQA